MNLTDRVRGILKPTPSPVASGLDRTTELAVASPDAALERTLGGAWRADGRASCFVVEQRVPGDTVYGRTRVRDLAGRLDAAATQASLLTSGAPARPPFVFFDLETTGLSAGAGTYAFLVGCAAFADDGAFVTKQYVMVKYGDERAMLETVARALESAGALVSFNGKSFDAPVLETRYLFHRLEWAAARLPHLDALHPARQFWGSSGVGRAALQHESTCSLIALEQQVLGAKRVGDVPGFEIPARYFQFVRSGDAAPLAAVLEHNRLDLLSLAGLTSRLLQLVALGPREAESAREALAIGRVYRRAGLDERARDAFATAVAMTEGPSTVPRDGPGEAVRIAALHALALSERRARHYEQAAVQWRQLLEAPECPSHLAREATEALAIHHEHRVRDLAAAKTFALRSLENGSGPAWRDAVGRRLTRIDRKMMGNARLLLE